MKINNAASALTALSKDLSTQKTVSKETAAEIAKLGQAGVGLAAAVVGQQRDTLDPASRANLNTLVGELGAFVPVPQTDVFGGHRLADASSKQARDAVGAVHVELLGKLTQPGGAPRAEIEALLGAASEAGNKLSLSDDREMVRSIGSFWRSQLVSQTGETKLSQFHLAAFEGEAPAPKSGHDDPGRGFSVTVQEIGKALEPASPGAKPVITGDEAAAIVSAAGTQNASLVAWLAANADGSIPLTPEATATFGRFIWEHGQSVVDARPRQDVEGKWHVNARTSPVLEGVTKAFRQLSENDATPVEQWKGFIEQTSLSGKKLNMTDERNLASALLQSAALRLPADDGFRAPRLAKFEG